MRNADSGICTLYAVEILKPVLKLNRTVWFNNDEMFANWLYFGINGSWSQYFSQY